MWKGKTINDARNMAPKPMYNHYGKDGHTKENSQILINAKINKFRYG